MQTATNDHPPINPIPQVGMIAGNPNALFKISPTPPGQTGIIEIPDYNGDTVVIPMPVKPNGFISVVINGQTYTLSSSPTPEPGQYYWDYELRSLIIAPYTDVSGLSVVYSIPLTVPLKSTQLTNYPEWFNQFIIVKADIKRQFQGHPSATIGIVSSKAKHNEIKEFFPVGKAFVINGLGLRVARCEAEEITNKLTANDKVKLAALDTFGQTTELDRIDKTSYFMTTISFQGHWESYGSSWDSPLDTPVSLRSLTTAIGTTPTGLAIASSDSNTVTYTINQVAAKVGVTIKGSSRPIKINSPIPIGESVTLRSLLSNERFYPDGTFINWENPNCIELLDWASMPSYVLPDRNVQISSNCGTFPIKLNNAHLVLDANTDSDKGDVWQWVTTGRADYQSPPRQIVSGWSYEAFDLNELRTASWCFDNTSEKTPHKDALLLNGETTYELEEEWGWIYTSKDVYTFYYNSNGEPVKVFSPGFPSIAEWGLVKQTEKLYIHDSSNGNYLLEIRGTVKELTRVKQESGQEAIDLVIEIDQESDPETIQLLQKELDAYTTFFWVTYPYSRVDTLDNLEDHYPELAPSDESPETYIPQLYTKQSNREEGFFLTFPDPRTTEDEPLPDITIGNKQREIQETIITSKRPERFKTITEVTSKSGQNQQKSAGSFDTTENLGKPSPAQRIEYFGVTSKTGENADDEIGKKYLISTHDAPPKTNLVNGTVSFPDIKRVSQGIKGVNTQYSIDNSKDASVNMSFKYQLPVIMGQKIIHEGKMLRVFELTETWSTSSIVSLDNVEGVFGEDIVINAQYKAIKDGQEIE